MSKNEDAIFQSLITGGLIGAALGALITGRKKENTILSAIAGAVLLATYEANKQAQEKNLPVYIEENGQLFEVVQGKKKYIKDIPKPSITISEYYKLK
jgi:outer membrane lipoprotein SlyB